MADVTAQGLLILTPPSTGADYQSGFSNQVRHSSIYSESLA